MPGAIHVEDIAYEHDGVEMLGRLAYDETQSGTRPAVLLCHEAPGIDDNVKSRAERLAALGYVAFGLDCHGGGRVLALDEVMQRLGALVGDVERFRSLGFAGLDVLLAQPQTDRNRVAAIGFCMGGALALELARAGADLKAVVGFHPSLETSRPEDAKNIRASVLVCCGTADPIIPPEHRRAFEQEMTAGGVADWRMDLYGDVGHSFTNKAADDVGIPGIAYHEDADRRSWKTMLSLFEEKLGPV
jgi:dienelactone hydrolase